MPVTERGEWKSVQFRVEEITADQYPESCTFTKSAKGDSTKWVDSFAKDNPVGTNIEVEYKLKSVVYQDKKTGEEKMFNEIVAVKTLRMDSGKKTQTTETVSQQQFDSKVDENGLTQEPLPTDDSFEDTLPF